MLVLLLSHFSQTDMAHHAKFASGLPLGIPLSATFLIPFIFAPRLNMGFWSAFGLGLMCLAGGYAVHRAVIGHA